MDMQRYMDMALEVGFDTTKEMDVATIYLNPALRDMCNPEGCHSYGKYWTCPPACGDLCELKALYDQYSHGIIVQTLSVREHEFDYEAFTAAGLLHKSNVAKLKEKYNALDIDALPLSAGACILCETCAYPDAPCRHPEKVHKSMSASGMNVSELCKENGLKYYYGKDSICYVACFLFK